MMDAVFIIVTKLYIIQLLLSLLLISNNSWLGIDEKPLEDVENSPCSSPVGLSLLVTHVALFLLQVPQVILP